jgi:hypothetical protein
VGFGCSVQSLDEEQSKKSKPNNGSKKVLSSYEKNRKVTDIDFSKRRDLYNRQNLLQNSLEKVNELPNPDKDDILIHIQHLTDNRMAVLTDYSKHFHTAHFQEKTRKAIQSCYHNGYAFCIYQD